MKKFSLIKYLDPFDPYDDLSFLDIHQADKIEPLKNSEIYKNVQKNLIEMISNLQSIESAILRGDLSAIYALEDKDLHDIKRMIKRIRKRFIDLVRLTSKTRSKKYQNKL